MSHQQHDRPENDWFTDLMGDLAMQLRRETAQSLLRGNDTQCFTTQAYLDRYIRDRVKATPTMMDLALARKHLESLAMIEFAPDVWREPPCCI